MAMLTDADREFLSRPIPAWVTTVRSDGSLHSTIVWIDTEGDEVVFTTLTDRVKARNLARDPRVSVSVLDPENPWHFISVAGNARLDTTGVDEVVGHIRGKYAPDREAGAVEPTRVAVRVAPQHVVRIGR